MATQSLVVSSDPEILGAMRALFNEAGMGVEVCSDAEGAFRSIRNRKFDTVIVDCDADDSGLDLLSTLRREQANQKTLAVGITGNYSNMKTVFDSGATFVLSKPLPVEDARRILRISKGVLTRAVRRFLRLPVENIATVTLGDHVEAIIMNISQGGLAIHSPKDLGIGQMIYTSFLLPETFDLIEGMAQVMWVEPGGRAGLEFRSLTDEAQKQVQRWIQKRAKEFNVEFDESSEFDAQLNSPELQSTLQMENSLKMVGATTLGALLDLFIVAAGVALFLGFGMLLQDKSEFGRTQFILGLSAGIVFWLIYRFLFYFFNILSPGEEAVRKILKAETLVSTLP